MKGFRIWPSAGLAVLVLVQPLSAQEPGGFAWFPPRTLVLEQAGGESWVAQTANDRLSPIRGAKTEGFINGAMIGGLVGFVGTVLFLRASGDDGGYDMLYGIYLGAPVGAIVGAIVGVASAVSGGSDG